MALLLFPHGRLRGRDRRLTQGAAADSARHRMSSARRSSCSAWCWRPCWSEGDLITYGLIFPLGMIALSFVPLAGYAGQISLCQLSMAGIGAVVWAYFGGERDNGGR